MKELKRIRWKVGQPLLPLHLVLQENSLLAHFQLYSKLQGLPVHGYSCLKWDSTQLAIGNVDITKLSCIFPNGTVADLPYNARIPTYFLNSTETNHVTLYLHLLKELSEEEVLSPTDTDQEPVTFAIHQLMITEESYLSSSTSSMKLASFEKDEGQWRLIHADENEVEGHPQQENYFLPPLISITNQPFLMPVVERLHAAIKGFENELVQESSTGKKYTSKTLETSMCLLQLNEMNRYLENADRGINAHPFYLYEHLSKLLSTLALFYKEADTLEVIQYQHDRLALTLLPLLQKIEGYLKGSGQSELRRIKFFKRDDCYVSENIPQEVLDTENVYLIIQAVDSKIKPRTEGIKLAAYSRLAITVQFALSGIELLGLPSAPFNNNFSKHADIYSLKKDSEWDFAMKEKKMALTHQGDKIDLQVYLYWKPDESDGSI